ncbi:rhomboid family intramembrane serine protease [Flavobacterium sp.]|uniref:rhomboid family intramembrane serine protease n=1 Tax=Flavobacterium sp. TaxID=239 RepID=UPI00286E60CB|nr:rhomboid family intramembrane serine protease [Flavobacterium sp.]
MREITDTVKQLIIINIIFFIGTELIGTQAKELLSLYYFESSKFRFWQPITHIFMHGGIMHIAFNMFALYSFGSMLESFWGGKKFLFFYISCGLGAAALHTGISYFEMQDMLKGVSDLNLSKETMNQILSLTVSDDFSYRPDLFVKELEPLMNSLGKTQLINDANFEILFETAKHSQIPMVGASGAIYGLLVAFAFMFPNAGLMLLFVPFPIKAKYFVPGLLVVDLFLGLKGNSIFGGGGTGIAHFAHIGGALIGFIMMWFWKKNSFNDRRWN